MTEPKTRYELLEQIETASAKWIEEGKAGRAT